ncbi:hypothetical protein EV421DRAFT_1914186 [Armillaria borealis]|uniref:Uncharacterized protein n=1 Tax=Armillaria borealis TaxID=47425 RepID=A0AA39ISP5_9AGAR|nr:hypothetical protein EV421DRAFT_1914186 [Armillaria borealis]
MGSYPSEFTLQNRGAMLKATSFELLLYDMLLLIQNNVSANQDHTLFRDTCYSQGVYDLDMTHDRGRSRLIQCRLVIVMYLIVTSPLAIRSMFVEGIRNDETQETIYIYTPGWIPLSSMAFMVNILITDCIVILWCWFLCGRRWMFVAIPGLCTIVGTSSSLSSLLSSN